MIAKTGFKLRPLGNEFILVAEGLSQVNFDKIISMNESAAFLWKTIENGMPFSAQSLAQSLLEEYEIDEQTALSDAQKTIEEWLKDGIIE